LLFVTGLDKNPDRAGGDRIPTFELERKSGSLLFLPLFISPPSKECNKEKQDVWTELNPALQEIPNEQGGGRNNPETGPTNMFPSMSVYLH
jgi:hypothetical protein